MKEFPSSAIIELRVLNPGDMIGELDKDEVLRMFFLTVFDDA